MAHLRRRSSFINKGEAPIMSFQTDINGTFDPSFNIPSGTLRWVIDDEEFISNSPSKALTGSTVDVEVFANGIVEGASTISTNFAAKNIIGELDLRHFTLSGNINLADNSGLNSTLFSNFANTSTSLSLRLSNYTTLDLSSFTHGGTVNIAVNSGLSSISVGGINSTLSLYRADGCALDVSTIDSIFSVTNTHMSSNPPLNDLLIRVNGGTNASPTGGASNTDIVNLRDVVYPAAGFTFTATIN